MATDMRVKDLAAELNVTNKDILNTLRQLGIQVKSHMSGLTEEEAGQVRNHMKAADAETEVIRREVQPGVIVRRRKKARPAKPPEPEPQEAEAPEAEAEPVAEAEAEAAPAPEAEEPSPAPEPEPEVEAEAEPEVRIIEPPEAQAEPVAEPEPVVEAGAGEEAPAPAPEAEAGEAAPVEAEAEETAEPEAEAAPEPQTEAGEPEAEAPVQTEAPEAEGEKDKEAGDDAKKKKRKKKKDESTGPQVKIISMPEPGQTPTPPSRPSRPAPRTGPGGRPGPRPGPGQPPPPADDGRSGKKKRKKDRRVVEFSPQPDMDPSKRGRPRQIQDRNLGPRGRGPRRKKGQRQEIPAPQPITQPVKAAKRKIRIEDAIRLSDLAKQMGIKAQEIIKALFGLNVMATINQALDFDTATLVASEFGYEVENVAFAEADYLIPQEADKPEDLKSRPPVVTIMGHVDHGKTSLLDAIRSTNITEGEAGGITQHIGAYHVQTSRGEIVFLDTPGHEAFTTMRARGAKVTDIVVLVVAADDGVMDQTREAVSHSKAAGVPIVVAVNKIDKEGANPDRVKRELSELGLVAEDWGGDVIFANVSAKMKTGLDELLELLALQAEVLELKANPDKPARGRIVEAKLDKGRGPLATVLIQEGTIKKGDSFVCGLHHGKVRAMFDDQGKIIDAAGPAMPVEVQGFDGVPDAGDEFTVVADEKVARRIAESRQTKQREKELAGKSKVTLESFLASRPEAEAQHLNLVLKTDVHGSLEAVSEALNKLSTDEVMIDIIHGGTGAITESDILLASASDAIIIGFNVRPSVKVKDVAEQEHVEIRFYDIIYKLVGDVKDAMSGMLAPSIEESYLGQAEVRETFNVPKVGTVAGCAVVDGKLTRNAGVRLLREGVVVYTGKLSSLKRFKDDAKEVAKGYECGVGLENFNDVKVGDFIEAFEEKEVARTLD